MKKAQQEFKFKRNMLFLSITFLIYVSYIFNFYGLFFQILLRKPLLISLIPTWSLTALVLVKDEIANHKMTKGIKKRAVFLSIFITFLVAYFITFSSNIPIILAQTDCYAAGGDSCEYSIDCNNAGGTCIGTYDCVAPNDCCCDLPGTTTTTTTTLPSTCIDCGGADKVVGCWEKAKNSACSDVGYYLLTPLGSRACAIGKHTGETTYRYIPEFGSWCQSTNNYWDEIVCGDGWPSGSWSDGTPCAAKRSTEQRNGVWDPDDGYCLITSGEEPTDGCAPGSNIESSTIDDTADTCGPASNRGTVGDGMCEEACGADPACDELPLGGCSSNGNTYCDWGCVEDDVDNDQDGCEDCGFTWLTADSICCGDDANEANPYEVNEVTCNDFNDNDCDGLTDLNDPDCAVTTCPSECAAYDKSGCWFTTVMCGNFPRCVWNATLGKYHFDDNCVRDSDADSWCDSQTSGTYCYCYDRVTCYDPTPECVDTVGCVECNDDGDCTDPWNSKCDMVTYTCVPECSVDGDCTDPVKHRCLTDALGAMCVQCYENPPPESSYHCKIDDVTCAGYPNRYALCDLALYTCTNCGPCNYNEDCKDSCCDRDPEGPGGPGDCLGSGPDSPGSPYLCVVTSPAEWTSCNKNNVNTVIEADGNKYICIVENENYMWIEGDFAKKPQYSIINLIIQFFQKILSFL